MGKPFTVKCVNENKRRAPIKRGRRDSVHDYIRDS